MTTKTLFGGGAVAVMTAVALSASASVTETIYGLNSSGGIDFSDPLYSFNLGGSINLGNSTTTLFSSGDGSLGSWGLPSGSDYGAELSGDVSAPGSGWYTFDLGYNGNVVTVTSKPGEGADSSMETTVYLPGGDSSFSFDYAQNGATTTPFKFYVEGDDPIPNDGPGQGDPVPDSAALIWLFPGVVCAGHAFRRRFSKA